MTLGTEIVGHVALVELQDPPHNFLSVEQVKSVADALEALDANMNVRCAVIAAQGRSFCAGANFAGGRGGSPTTDGDDGGARDRPDDLYAQAARLLEIGIPFIAAIQGPAIGGGLGFAMTANFRVTCPEARFSANFVKLGIHQGFGLSVTLPEVVGPTKAAEVLLGGKRYNGEDATAMGMADRCVPQSELRDAAFALANEIATGAPLAIRSINRTLRAGLGDRVRKATQHEAAEQARLFATDDFREGAASVAERRPGNFTGR